MNILSENSKKSTTKDGRYRQWTIIIYPESVPHDWQDKISDLRWAQSPLHDKDVNPDGTLKKPHHHIMIVFDGKKSYEQVKIISDSINGASPQFVRDIRGMLRYFAHLDNPEKTQYDKSKIIGHGFDVSKYLESDEDIDQLEQEIEIYCEKNHINEYAQLIKISRQFDGWHKCVSTHTIHFRAFVNSLRHGLSTEDVVQSILKDDDDLKSQ